MRKRTKNAGFSLVELIVTISVVTVLVGAFAPRFVVYVTSRRQQACVANREALLNIYEKAVYDDLLLIDTDDLGQVIQPDSSTKLNTEYSNEAKEYLTCSSGGTYKAFVDGGVAYIACTEHPDEVCSVRFDNWVEKAALVIDSDPEYDVPTDVVDPSEGVSDPEEEEVPVVDTTVLVNTGIWPRPMDAQGRIDERWALVGLQPGKTVAIGAPVHFIDITGVEIVVVKPINVKYEDAAYPLGKGSNALDGVVAASGIVYDGTNEPAKYIQNGEGHYEYQTVVKTYDIDSTSSVTVNNEILNKNNKKDKGRPVSYWYVYWCGNDKCPDVGQRRSFEQPLGSGSISTEIVNNKVGKSHSHEDPNKKEVWVEGEEYITYRVNYGDMYVVNGITYIYANNSGTEECVELPDATQVSYGVSYNGWYRVPDMTE